LSHPNPPSPLFDNIIYSAYNLARPLVMVGARAARFGNPLISDGNPFPYGKGFPKLRVSLINNSFGENA
jgi:hypothetical protein